MSATRERARSPLELAFSTAVVNTDRSRPGVRRTTIGDLLLGTAGVLVGDRGNPSQDPRLTIRGFGARSAFGVRGVRVLRDGVPLSLPDGQTPIDWLDLETIGSIEVVRGTTAALYGNAAGGVVDFRSRDPEPGTVAASARVWGGGRIGRTNATVSGRFGGGADVNRDAAVARGGYLASFTATRGDGPRAWSRTDASSAFLRGFTSLGGTRVEVQGTHYDAARAENPGALTALELEAAPRLADSLNVAKRSRKAARQSAVTFIASREGPHGDVTANAIVSSRVLDNPLPFAIVAVDRHVAGGTLRGSRRLATPWPIRVALGIDAQRQRDARLNFENCADFVGAPTTRCPDRVERGAVRLNQVESIEGIGAFARGEVEGSGRVFISAAVRRDAIDFTVRDAFVTSTNADDSGDRTLQATSPMFGIAWRARPLLSVYANVATAFETPTVTELTNRDDGSAGLNTTLQPQRTRTTEVGVQGYFANRVHLDVSAFRARVLDELVSFDVPNQPGRRAFRNAGRTSRAGIETSAILQLDRIESGIAFTASRFRYDQYVVGTASFAGRAIPGIPAQQLQGYTTLRALGAFATAEVVAASRTSADDGSTVYAPGYAAWNLRVGVNDARVGHVRIEPVLGVDNLFDRHYASAVVINATRGRYFEPGATRRVYAALRIGAR